MQIFEVTEGILSGLKTVTNVARDAFTRGAFRYGAAQTGVNLAPYFPEPDSDNVVRMKDTNGVEHVYTKHGNKYYENNKEVDPATAAGIDAYAKQNPTTKTKPATTTKAVAQEPTAQTQPSTAAPAPAVVKPETTGLVKKHTGGKVVGQLSQSPDAIRKRAARLAKKTAAPSAAGANAFGAMAQQLAPTRTASSTGGTVTQTPTGLVHTAKPVEKPAVKTVAATKKKTPARKAPATKTTTKPVWKGRGSRGKGLSKQQQDYIAAINAKYPKTMAESQYTNLEKMLSQVLTAQGHTK